MDNEYFIKLRSMVDEHIMDFLPDIDHNSITLYEAMKYSLTAGGKRFRPVLLLAACEFAGGSVQEALPYACALEYIHSYSLIHDDLPAMDDDDFRRGKPANHKVYGDAIAILAGDGLLSSAFEIMLKDMMLYFDQPQKLKARARAAYELAKGAGVRGMVAGQIADIEAEDHNCSVELLNYIHTNKTGALIVASVRAGAYLGDPDEEMLAALTTYAEYLGLLFQMTDDILDVTGTADELGKDTGADSRNHKNTYISMYDVDAARRKAEELAARAGESLAGYYDNAEFFNMLTDYVLTRKK